jgi:hypothetical protein
MDNADMPAMPQPIAANNHEVIDTTEYSSENGGLTKREHFAALAMQGILSNKCYEPPRRIRIEGMAKDAVMAADELLKQLSNGE